LVEVAHIFLARLAMGLLSTSSGLVNAACA
jgi:hypothetical protein